MIHDWLNFPVVNVLKFFKYLIPAGLLRPRVQHPELEFRAERGARQRGHQEEAGVEQDDEGQKPSRANGAINDR